MIAAKSIELSFRDDLSRLPHSIGKMSQGGESVGLQAWTVAGAMRKSSVLLLKCASLSTSDVMAGPARRHLVGLRISLEPMTSQARSFAFRLHGRIQGTWATAAKQSNDMSWETCAEAKALNYGLLAGLGPMPQHCFWAEQLLTCLAGIRLSGSGRT